MQQLTSKVVVVTGAGSGLGRAAARELLAAGHRVALAGRRAQTLAETAGGHPNSRLVPTDVTDPDSVRALFADVVAAFGRVDALFNNAGVFGPSAPITQIDDEQWQRTWRTNVDGSVFCAREAARIMTAQLPRGGRIINNGSLSAHRPRPHSLAYTVTKHAISGLTASMLLDLRDVDIAVTQLDIGNAATSMTAGFSERRSSASARPGEDDTAGFSERRSSASARPGEDDTAGFSETLQADGTLAAEPTFDALQVARAVAYLIDLPLEVAVPSMTIMARAMPYFGRG